MATPILTCLYYLIKSPIHDELVSGTFVQARADALIIISLTDILDSDT